MNSGRSLSEKRIVTTNVPLMGRVGMVSYSAMVPVMHPEDTPPHEIIEMALEIAGPVKDWTRYA